MSALTKGVMKMTFYQELAVKLNRIKTADQKYHRQKGKKKAYSDL